MRAVYINLDRSPDRRAWFERQASSIGLDVERFVAVDAKTLPGEEVSAAGVPAGALGCFYSHRNVWESIANGTDELVAVFEDDAHLSPDLPKFLDNPGWFPNDADIVHLERVTKRILAIPRPKSVLDRKLYPGALTSGTAGYVITRQCASYLFRVFREINQEFDHILFHGGLPQLNIYQIAPALCIQDQYVSDRVLSGTIERTSIPKETSTRRKLARETKRIARNLRHWLNRVLRRRKPVPILLTFR